MHTFLIFMVSFFSLLGAYEAKDFSYLIGMPGFNESLLNMHFKLYQGYVKNTNVLYEKLSSFDPNSYEYRALKRRFGWEFDGMRLHELYFSNLGGTGKLNLESSIYRAIIDEWGSFKNWQNEFIAIGSIRGIGWTILYLDLIEKRLMNIWINEHDKGHLVMGQAILVMDVWEHAYMPQYGLDRKRYINVFFNNINWQVVNRRYTQSLTFPMHAAYD